MVSPSFVYGLHLDALKRFSDHARVLFATQWSLIEGRRVEGQLSWEDLEFEDSICVESLEIAARAVVQELANLIERAMQDAARVPFQKSKHAKGTRTVSTWEAITLEDLKAQPDIDRCRFEDLLSLINGHYGISIESLERWADIERVRNTANDLKHRFGRLNKIEWSADRGLPQYRKVAIEQAQEDIGSVSVFLHKLVDLTKTEDGTSEQTTAGQ